MYRTATQTSQFLILVWQTDWQLLPAGVPIELRAENPSIRNSFTVKLRKKNCDDDDWIVLVV